MENTLVLITATAARKIATDIRNEEMSKCLQNLMEQIKEEALKGGTFKFVKVKANRPNGFYELLIETFKNLGYDIVFKGRKDGGTTIEYLIVW